MPIANFNLHSSFIFKLLLYLLSVSLKHLCEIGKIGIEKDRLVTDLKTGLKPEKLELTSCH